MFLSMYKYGSTKITNPLKESDEDDLKFQTRNGILLMIKITDNMEKEIYKNDSTKKINTEVVKPNLYDYSDAYILVTGNIAVVNGNNNTKDCFKNCNPFIRCVTHLFDEHVETADNLDIIMNLYNLIKYSDNYEQSSGSLFQYKRQEQPLSDAGNIDNVTVDSSSSFKYK